MLPGHWMKTAEGSADEVQVQASEASNLNFTTMEMEEPLTSTVRPNTLAVITVRIVKSFPYRTVKNHVFKDLDLTTTTAGQLLDMIKQGTQRLFS